MKNDSTRALSSWALSVCNVISWTEPTNISWDPAERKKERKKQNKKPVLIRKIPFCNFWVHVLDSFLLFCFRLFCSRDFLLCVCVCNCRIRIWRNTTIFLYPVTEDAVETCIHKTSWMFGISYFFTNNTPVWHYLSVGELKPLAYSYHVLTWFK